jgi:hypothetical protein
MIWEGRFIICVVKLRWRNEMDLLKYGESISFGWVVRSVGCDKGLIFYRELTF